MRRCECRTAPGECKVYPTVFKVFSHLGPHPAFPDQGPDATVKQEPGQFVHPGRRCRAGGYDFFVLHYRTTMIDRRTTGVEGDTLVLHPLVRLVACGINNSGKLDMVTCVEVQDFISKRRMQLYNISGHRFTSMVACRWAQHCTFTATGNDAV